MKKCLLFLQHVFERTIFYVVNFLNLSCVHRYFHTKFCSGILFNGITDSEKDLPKFFLLHEEKRFNSFCSLPWTTPSPTPPTPLPTPPPPRPCPTLFLPFRPPPSAPLRIIVRDIGFEPQTVLHHDNQLAAQQPAATKTSSRQAVECSRQPI